MEEVNKYWLEEDERRCVFCDEGWDNMEHYIGSCRKLSEDWSKLGIGIGKIMEKLWEDELGRDKERIFGNVWNIRKKVKKLRKEKEMLVK
jgi:hypothetical protein